MSDSGKEQTPVGRPAASSKLPGGGKGMAEGSEEPSGASGKTVYLLDPMRVSDLAIALHTKPFKVVGDLMAMKVFKGPDDMVDFKTAALVARKHGYRAERPPPGVLVL